MSSAAGLTFKIASEEWEFEEIHRLNYKTFVEEIPQHRSNPAGILVDRFHHENTYIICIGGKKLLGMVAVRDKRPFSLDEKLENLDSYLPPARSPCEFRLLAIEKDHRAGLIFKGLMELLHKHCMSQGYDLALASGTLRQQKLYRHLGFAPFGPLVGSPDALFQPMYLTLEKWREKAPDFIHLPGSSEPSGPINLLPGPVAISREVSEALRRLPISHRSESFLEDFHETKKLLCNLVRSRHVEVLMGSGTLANDAIAGQLSLLREPGLILSNGEFGCRLIDHATRFGLSFDVLDVEWGAAFDPEQVELAVKKRPRLGWVWAVHCETSTGVLNDMDQLKRLCSERGARLCLDCISSIGLVPVDLTGVFLASGVSGKGLGAFPGLSMVFYNHEIQPQPASLPRYLDLGLYAANGGVPFTLSSNLLHALQTALKRLQSESFFQETERLSRWLRARLRELGFTLVAPEGHAASAVITIALPETLSSASVGRELEEAGYFLSYNSRYLLERNWLQICLMGECSREQIAPLVDLLEALCSPMRETLKAATTKGK